MMMGFMNRTMFGIAALALASTAWADFDGPAPMAWRWADRIERRPAGAPIMQGDSIYAALGSRMYCLNRENGNLVWRFPVGVPLAADFTTGSVVVGEIMIAAADDGAIYGVDKRSGEMVWMYMADDKVFSMPIVAGDSLVFATANNDLIAINAATGEPVWDEPYHMSAGIYSSLASWENYVFFMTSDRMLNSLNVITKRQAWRPQEFGSLSPLSEMTVFGDTIYVTSGNYVSALHVGTGRSRWSRILPGNLVFAPAASPDGVACLTDDGHLYFLDTRGQLVSRTGVDLRSVPAAGPSFVGSYVIVPTANGMLNLIDPFTGEMKWNFLVPPMIKGMKVRTGGGNSGGGGGGTPGLGGGGGTQDANEMVIKYVSAAAPAVVQGDTLILLAKDGSICAFDKNLGVDLTPPTARMVWPNAGDQVSGRAPMELVFIVEDEGSGINYDYVDDFGLDNRENLNSLNLTINGQESVPTIDKAGRIRIQFIRGGRNKPLPNGRAEIVLTISDGMGNTSTTHFVLTIDNTLPALGGPRLPDDGNAGRGGGSGPGFGGRGGGGRGGGGRGGG